MNLRERGSIVAGDCKPLLSNGQPEEANVVVWTPLLDPP
jgi:hypothetical protein